MFFSSYSGFFYLVSQPPLNWFVMLEKQKMKILHRRCYFILKKELLSMLIFSPDGSGISLHYKTKRNVSFIRNIAYSRKESNK
jgi:hypothetical protein